MIPIERDKHVYITGNLEQLLKKKKSVQKDLPKMVKVEAVTDFIFLGSKITTDDYCSHKIKRCFPLGRNADKSMQHIKK